MMKFMRRNKLLVFTVLLYIVLFMIDLDQARMSLSNSGYYLKEMLLVMPIVLIFTILINAWIPKEAISKHLGTSSKWKGNLYSFILGMLSTGPIYAAFPIAYLLQKKGASTENVVIILSAWAVIKVPMLFNEYKFLGFEFMITRWFLTVIAIFFIAKLTSLILLKLEHRYTEVLE